MRHNKWFIAICLAGLSGCAFGDAHLDIAYDSNKAIAGPLTTVPPQQVTIAKFTDSRPEPELIGYKRNGYGQHTADIKPNKPVSEIVQDAVTAVFRKGGNTIGDHGTIIVSGDIKTFWFDSKVNFWTIEFMAKSAIHLVVRDATDSSVIYENDYTGSYNEESTGGLEKTWQKVLNEALAKMCENISLDIDLANALKRHVTANESLPAAHESELPPQL